MIVSLFLKRLKRSQYSSVFKKPLATLDFLLTFRFQDADSPLACEPPISAVFQHSRILVNNFH